MNPLRALFLTLSRMPPAVMLLLIVGLAIVVTMLVMGQVNQQQESFKRQQEEMTAKMNQKSTVVYAKQDIPEGATISSDALEEKQVAVDAKPPDAFESQAMVVGRITKFLVPAGQIISAHDLQTIGVSTGFDSKIKDGYRAVTFPVDPNSGVAGFVAPGSHVDIIATVGSGRDTKASPILSDVEVIACGQTFQKAPAGQAVAQAAPNVTVALSPTDTNKLIKAVKAGSLYLSLRNDKDHSPVPVVDVTGLFEKPSSRSSDIAALPPPPANLPPPPGAGGPGGLATLAPPPPALHEVEQWSAGTKEVRSVPKD